MASVNISPSEPALLVGSQVALTATSRDGSGGIVTGTLFSWSSSNNAIASVTADGIVMANAVGTTRITASSSGVSGTSFVTVNEPPVASVQLVGPAGLLPIGSAFQLTVILRDGTGNILAGRSVVWLSTNPGIATVSSGGLVTAQAEGQTSIAVTSEGKTGEFNVEVPAPPRFASSGLEVSPGAGSVNQQITLNGTNFTGPNLRVSFGGIPAPSIDSATPTEIIVRVPSGFSGSVSITVSNDYGSTTADQLFTLF
ncbi:MAG: hypothetical protein HOH95_06420 [Dehalococcoidia bacterium]|nr:hypothetical protein [Dehalococcoidia bacterium]